MIIATKPTKAWGVSQKWLGTMYTDVILFDSKAERDNYLKDHPDYNDKIRCKTYSDGEWIWENYEEWLNRDAVIASCEV